MQLLSPPLSKPTNPVCLRVSLSKIMSFCTVMLTINISVSLTTKLVNGFCLSRRDRN